MEENKIAEVISVLPNKVKISVKDINCFKVEGDLLSIGSYLRIFDTNDCAIIAIIENFYIESKEEDKSGKRERIYIVEAVPLGFIDSKGKFNRGGNNIAIPPKTVNIATKTDIQKIYDDIKPENQFCFSKLVQDTSINVPVDGNRFFNKHIAIVGSTGSGKSHTVAKIVQLAKKTKTTPTYSGLNNSHIVIFDIHSEYKTAFPDAKVLDVNNIELPYWLMNGEELEELFLESGDFNNYNQSSILNRLISENKKKYNPELNKIDYGTPVKFSITEVLNCLINLSRETKSYKNPDEISIKGSPKSFNNDGEKYLEYFEKTLEFEEPKNFNYQKGNYADGTLDKFISRIKNKIDDKRLGFLLNEPKDETDFEDVIRRLISYKKNDESNLTIIDLSGVPFEVLSITISLISRILFDFAYHNKKNNDKNDTPLLIIFEEAHKYVPKTDLAKFAASRFAIERIAKEGRKYGITMAIVSQRPSEISETIFSQCNNFIAMRLTNPDDQNYVKRLLPDTLGPLTESLPILLAGEAILIGDSVVMPSLVKIDRCTPEPSSSDINYLDEWKKPWNDIDLSLIINAWQKK